MLLPCSTIWVFVTYFWVLVSACHACSWSNIGRLYESSTTDNTTPAQLGTWLLSHLYRKPYNYPPFIGIVTFLVLRKLVPCYLPHGDERRPVRCVVGKCWPTCFPSWCGGLARKVPGMWGGNGAWAIKKRFLLISCGGELMNNRKTRICELLGIKYPIIEAAMAWIGDANLAAAVSNAGAIGTIGPNGGC